MLFNIRTANEREKQVLLSVRTALPVTIYHVAKRVKEEMASGEEHRVLVPKSIAITNVVIDEKIELGGGSLATVYAGSWYGAKVAVKVLHLPLESGSEFIGPNGMSEILRQCEVSSRHRHPHVVQFFGVFDRGQAGLPALVTERMQTSLLESCTKSCWSGVRELRVLVDVSSALAYLHSQGALHGNLSLSNVFIDRDGRAKLGDVGLAMPWMSVGYGCSLEAVLLPGETYNEKTEIFSFGLLALAMTQAHRGAEPLQAAEVTLQQCMDLCSTIPSDGLRSIIVRCLSDDPRERPLACQLYEELVETLRQLTGSEDSFECDNSYPDSGRTTVTSEQGTNDTSYPDSGGTTDIGADSSIEDPDPELVSTLQSCDDMISLFYPEFEKPATHDDVNTTISSDSGARFGQQQSVPNSLDNMRHKEVR